MIASNMASSWTSLMTMRRGLRHPDPDACPDPQASSSWTTLAALGPYRLSGRTRIEDNLVACQPA